MRHRILIVLIPLALLSAVSVAEGADPSGVRPAVERGLRYLEATSVAWKEGHGCASCHHAPMMLWSCYVAKQHGYDVTSKEYENIRAWLTAEENTAKITPASDGKPPLDGPAAAGIYALLAFGATPPGGTPPALVKTIAQNLAKKQADDGTWIIGDGSGRAPMLEGLPVTTRMVRLALATAPANSDAVPAAIQKADAWLAKPADKPSLQIMALDLMLAVRKGSPKDAIDKAATAILALQRPDGSWSQTAERSGDAFATGQTLYALGNAGMRLTNPAIARAAAFLIDTQQPDGAWYILSRHTPIDVKTNITNEPITSVTAGWAVLGLLAVS